MYLAAILEKRAAIQGWMRENCDHFAILAGQKMHDSHGDDFIIGKDGKFKLVYPSHDRPQEESLLKVLDEG
jgi:hypothetical protein